MFRIKNIWTFFVGKKCSDGDAHVSLNIFNFLHWSWGKGLLESSVDLLMCQLTSNMLWDVYHQSDINYYWHWLCAKNTILTSVVWCCQIKDIKKWVCLLKDVLLTCLIIRRDSFIISLLLHLLVESRVYLESFPQLHCQKIKGTHTYPKDRWVGQSVHTRRFRRVKRKKLFRYFLIVLYRRALIVRCCPCYRRQNLLASSFAMLK